MKSKVGYSKSATPGIKGEFDVIVERVGADINVPLPFALFGSSALQSGYQSILSIPSGLTLEIQAGLMNTGDYNRVDFIYSDGVDTDIVRLTSSTLQYPELLDATKTDLLRYMNIKMQLSGMSDETQFNQSVLFTNNSIFGDKSVKTLNPASFKKSSQFQNNQIDLAVSGKIDKEAAILSKIVAQAGGQINFSFYFDMYLRYNAEILR